MVVFMFDLPVEGGNNFAHGLMLLRIKFDHFIVRHDQNLQLYRHIVARSSFSVYIWDPLPFVCIQREALSLSLSLSLFWYNKGWGKEEEGVKTKQRSNRSINE